MQEAHIMSIYVYTYQPEQDIYVECDNMTESRFRKYVVWYSPAQYPNLIMFQLGFGIASVYAAQAVEHYSNRPHVR